MNKFVILDIETTGVESSMDAIIEVALVVVEDWKIIEEFSSLIYTEKPIPSFVSKLTGIKPIDIQTAPHFDDIKEKLQSLIGDLPIVGHNIEFDISFLQEQGIVKDNQGLDTWELATTILPKLPSYGLEYLAWYYHFTDEKAHRALHDVKTNFELLKILVTYISEQPQSLKDKIISVIEKSNWDWKVLWQDKMPKLNNIKLTELINSIDLQVNDVSKITNELVGQINFINLPPQANELNVILSVANELQNCDVIGDYNQMRILENNADKVSIPIINQVNFNEDNWQRLLNQPQFNDGETKLVIKIIQWLENGGFSEKGNYLLPHLTRDEVYLWQRRISDRKPIFARADNFITHYNNWLDDIKDAKELSDKSLIVGNAFQFFYSLLTAPGFYLNQAMLEGSIASRRDFLATLRDTGSINVDELYKLVGRAGELFVKLNELLVEFYLQKHTLDSKGYSQTLITGDWMWQSQPGIDIGKTLDELINVWETFNEQLSSIEVKDKWLNEYREYQITRVNLLLEKIKIIRKLDNQLVIIIDAYERRFTLRAVPRTVSLKLINKLKEYKRIVFIGNSLVKPIVDEYNKILGINGRYINIDAKEIINIELIQQELNTDEIMQMLNKKSSTLFLTNNKTKAYELWEDYSTKAPSINLEIRDTVKIDEEVNNLFKGKRKLVATFREVENMLVEGFPDLDEIVIVSLPYEMVNAGIAEVLQVTERDKFNKISLPYMATALNRAVVRLHSMAPKATIKIIDPKLAGYVDKLTPWLEPYVKINRI